MRNLSFAGTSLLGLFRNLRADVKTLIREELELVRSEMLEKISCYSRNAVILVIGGFVAYAGLIVLFGGIGVLIGFAFQKLGLDSMLATFIGLGAMGLLVIIVGAVMILNGMKAMSAGTLAPERTLDTIKHLKGTEQTETDRPKGEEAPKRSPEELHKEALATEERIGEELAEIAYRTSPTRIKQQTAEHVRTHPYTWSGIALAAGFMGSLLVGRKFRRA